MLQVVFAENLSMGDCYDRMASLYHLIFQDWDESIVRQAAQLASIIEDRWGPGARHILDVSCGIGTQAIGLANRGFLVTASDLSETAVSRARIEAQRRGATIAFSISDMRAVYTHHQRQFDAVISVDNCITHLLNDDDLLLALRQMYECTRSGGGCLITVKDYNRAAGPFEPFGIREEDGKRYIIFQVWEFVDQVYELAMYFVVDDGTSGPLVTHVMRTKYNAIGRDHLRALMRRAGFTNVEWLDGCFYHPVLIGNREA